MLVEPSGFTTLVPAPPEGRGAELEDAAAGALEEAAPSLEAGGATEDSAGVDDAATGALEDTDDAALPGAGLMRMARAIVGVLLLDMSPASYFK